MPERISSRGQFHNRNRSLWQFVLLLVVMVAVTITLVATCLYQFIHHSDYEINLYQGLVSSAQNGAGSSGGVVRSSASKTSGKNAKEFNFKVSDDENVWSTDTTIELFQASYRNDKGELTVQSADGSSVIAPGTGGSYTFSLKNAGKLDSNYQVWLSADMNVSSSGFPIEFRMSGANGWMTGDNGVWKTADELNDAVAQKNLYSGKSDEYTLYWRWAYDRNADAEDTSYGNLEVKQNADGSGSSSDGSTGNVTGSTMQISQSVSYTVTLHTLAAEGIIDFSNADDTQGSTPDADTAKNSNQNNKKNTEQRLQKNITDNDENTVSDKNTAQYHGTSTSRKAAKTGDDTVIWTWILMLGMAEVVVLTVVWRRRKSETDKQIHE